MRCPRGRARPPRIALVAAAAAVAAIACTGLKTILIVSTTDVGWFAKHDGDKTCHSLLCGLALKHSAIRYAVSAGLSSSRAATVQRSVPVIAAIGAMAIGLHVR